MANPRLKSLLIRDFRSISGEWTIPLDANVVLVHGQNGAGKTSVLSALELAATGSISHLDRAGDTAYRRHLHHRGTRSGHVTLKVAGLDGISTGAASLTDDGSECVPLLDLELAEAFTERCLLPQATLGRLFEVYAPIGRREAETPLIRFVKEMLGLETLDALIDGLHATGHISRAQKLSRAWPSAEDGLSRLRGTLAKELRSREVLEARVAELTGELREHLDDPPIGSAEGDIAGLIAAVDAKRPVHLERKASAARMREAVLRLDVVESTLRQGGLSGTDPNDPADDAGLAVAEARYAEWTSSRARVVTDWLAANRPDIEIAAAERASSLLRHLTSAIDEQEAALVSIKRRLELIEALSAQISSAQSRIDLLAEELRRLESSRSKASGISTAAGLASVLVSLLDHVEGGTCPVCDQGFPHGSLREHIREKVQSLDADAARFLELETARSSVEAQHRAVEQELLELKARRGASADAVHLKSEESRCTNQLVELRSLVGIADAGRALEEEVSHLREAKIAAAHNRSLLDRCIADLDDVAALMNVDRPIGLLPQRVATLRAQAEAALDDASRQEARSAGTLRLRDELESVALALEQANALIAQHESAVSRVAAQIAEARRRKERASELRKAAEELRTATTTRVFDEHLNESWSRIFKGLVPSEPFVPQFKRPLAGARNVAVEIETVDREGRQAATPAAMLSQGNLNTAALSLFMALHFAVPARLPWLIFDDPVQSMDDLHISNFAAMVKQLTRRNGRQVLIAVHQRELFEYLALELTPASPGEEQLQIVLDRTYGRSVIQVERLEFREDHALVPTTAA